MPLPEFGERGRQHVVAEPIRCSDSDLAGQGLLSACQVPLKMQRFFFHAFGSREHGHAGIGQQQTGMTALEQRRVDRLFQGGDAATYRRLRHAELPCGGAKRAGPRDGEKELDVAPFHCTHLVLAIAFQAPTSASLRIPPRLHGNTFLYVRHAVIALLAQFCWSYCLRHAFSGV